MKYKKTIFLLLFLTSIVIWREMSQFAKQNTERTQPIYQLLTQGKGLDIFIRLSS